MNTDASWWQYAVLGLIVLASLIQVVRKVAPRLATGVQARCDLAYHLNEAGQHNEAKHSILPPRRVGIHINQLAIR